MKKALLAQLWACFIFISATVSAQSVQFKVELLPDGITYRVSVKPSVTWTAPNNTVLGAQVTVLVPTGAFQVTNVIGINGAWTSTPKISAPAENPAFDYFVFYMQNSPAMPLTANVETPLFTFQRSGACSGAVELINNNLDAFMPPNSLSLNVGNDFTTVGGGAAPTTFGRQTMRVALRFARERIVL